MRTLSLFCSVAAVLAMATPALADPCSTTLSFGSSSNYQYNLLGQRLGNRPILQSSGTYTCGDWSVNGIAIVRAGTNGTYGNRGNDDENDFMITRDHTYKTGMGPIDVQASVSYWKYAPFGSSDANLVFALEVNRPIVVKTVTITPFLHLTQFVGIGNVPSEANINPGVRGSLPLTSKWTVQGELGVAQNFARNAVFDHQEFTDQPKSYLDHPPQIHRTIPYANLSAVRDFGHDLSGTVAVQLMPYAPASIGFTLQKKF